MNLKNIVGKFIAALVAVYLVLGNCAMAGIGIAQVIAEETSYSTPRMSVDFEFEKYDQYNSEGIKGAEVQTKVELKAIETSQQDILPIDTVEFKIQLPSIGDVKPDRANVINANTSMSNEIENCNVNQNYNKDTGLLTVSYNNTNNHSAYTNMDAFEIIYVYGEGGYINQGDLIQKTPQKVECEIKFKTPKNVNIKTLKASVEKSLPTQTEVTGENLIKNSVDFELKDTEEVYKGYMYCNEENKTSYETDFNTISELSIINKDALNGVQIYLNKSKFTLNNEELDANSIHYKYTKISEEDFNKVFGQDGELDFYIGTTKYASIKYAEVDGNKKFVTEYYTQTLQNIEPGKVEYLSETFNVLVRSTKPINEGKVIFEEAKKIIGESDYKTKVSNINGIKETRKITITRTNAEGIEEVLNDKDVSKNIELKEPSTQIALELSNNKLSTLTTNKITATIKINDTNSSCKLMDGGKFEISLPNNIVSSKVVNAKSLYENGISIKKAKIEKGKIVLDMSGKQTTYDTLNISGGVNIVVDLEIDIDDTVATHNETITAKYNEAVISKEIEITSVNNVLVVSKTTGYDTQNNEVTNIGSKTHEIKVLENESEKEVKHTISIVNNYEDSINDVQIIGRIGYSNSTFETKLAKAIEVNKNSAKVYYSDNKNASYNDVDWVEQFSNNAKSYKVVLKNNILAKSDSVEIDLYVQIPANLGFNQSTFLRTDLDYKYNNENKSTFSMTNLFTPKEEVINNNNITGNENENIELSITPFITQNYIHAGQRVIYKVRVGNRTNHKLENISLIDVLPQNTIYVKNEEREGQGANYLELLKYENKDTVNWTTTLDANSFKEFEIMVIAKEDITKEEDFINTVKAVYNGQELSVVHKLIVKPSKITVDLVTAEENWIDPKYNKDEIIEYRAKVKNITKQSINNVKVKYNLPQYITFVDGGLGIYDEIEGYKVREHGTIDNGTFEYNINKLNVEEEKVIIIKCKVQRLQGVYEANINGIVNVVLDNDIYESNVKTIKTLQPGYTISIESNKKATDVLEKGDGITYKITIKNVGEKSGGFSILDSIPEQIEVRNLSYQKGKGEEVSIATSKNNINLDETLNVGETIIVNISGVVKEFINNEDTVNISNFAILKDGEYEQKSNEITNIIKCSKNTTVNPNNPNNPNTPGNSSNPDSSRGTENTGDFSDTTTESFSISGVAWLDTNKDGKRDDGERLLSGIKIYLVDNKTGKIVTDSEGKEISLQTTENGEYKFEGIKQGNYLVIFEFDINKYKATKYQVSVAGSASNSDAIISKIKIDGNEKTVGATNVLTLKSNLDNIDIGLIEDAKFDLSLEKQISKISVINDQGTKTTEYENMNFAKTDLVAKYMNNTSVIVTYKFIIRNIGDVIGYVDVLKDNLPKGLQFSSELNKDWYKGEDGALYTEALSGIAIEPGKTSEIELVLTKDTTENSTGTFTNTAELEKISNIEAVEQAQKDNDKSSADMVISIKTGSPILYIGITLVSVTIIAVGAYIIKKKILNRVI